MIGKVPASEWPSRDAVTKGIVGIVAMVLFGIAAVSGGHAQEGDLLLEGDLLRDDGAMPLEGGLLGEPQADEPAAEAEPDAETVRSRAAKEHAALFMEDRYPSATTCKTCHERHYREWSVSQHAYAQLSPVYMAMQRISNQRTSGTTGDFCIRCHTPIGMNLGEPVSMNNFDRHPTSREGVTCVVCHRVSQAYGKVSGRIGIDQGGLVAPVRGPRGDEELERVLENRDTYRVVTDPDAQGREIHRDVERFFQLVQPGFCGTCHDVTLPNGFRQEEAFSEFKASPAALQRDGGPLGAACQDCHMGKEQGRVSGYHFGPAAEIGGVETKPRKLTNHYFAGPDHSIVHPGIFPHNVEAARMATLREWVEFDYEAGWGTDAFENNIPEDQTFPERWQSIDDRYDARAILDEQEELLAWARQERLEVLRNGYLLGDVVLTKADRAGIAFSVEVKSGTTGHNVPTGFIAERLVYLRVTVLDPDGIAVFLSGDLDVNGDLRDSHSLLVLSGDVERDDQLFNLQSHFITLNNRGGDREQILPAPYSLDVLPFVRPATNASILAGRPTATRIQRKGIEPLGDANFIVDG